ncbi:unnamed protein product [Enterobius vermicularis]|uniref:NEK6-subfamily protein kinase n=1 Tax=Enterobius vermicularis TaxID=51028 RepID=A0A158QB13_ENTVE|nr:unnamed protein product [Enterobius vermicularis]
MTSEQICDDLAIRYGTLEAFEIEKKIGKGQFSDVHRARCKEDGRKVALKRIKVYEMTDQKAIEDCQKEIHLHEKLDHVNIIKCYTSFIEDGQMYIVLELADGGDLNRLIRYYKSIRSLIPERIIWRYFVQIIRGLEHMHSRRILHRDIKPANVFITADETVKLGDLGLGRLFSFKTTAAHSLVGTPYYMSPERIKDAGYSFKSDMWSIGCLLYEMVALQSPFYGDKQNLLSLCKKIENCEYPPLPSDIYSEQIRDLIARCLSAIDTERPDVWEVLDVAERLNTYFNVNAEKIILYFLT